MQLDLNPLKQTSNVKEPLSGKEPLASSGPAPKSVLPKVGPSDSLKPYLIASVATMVLLVGGLGGWAATSNLAGAVLAQGTVIVDSNVKKVQHPSGGVVGEIRIKDGSKVQAGDILVRLDETVTRANLLMVSKQLDELAIRQARLKAERDRADAVETPPLLIGREHDRVVREMIAGEQSLFDSRRSGRASQKAQLKERMGQIAEEIRGITRQQQAKTSEVELVRIELAGLTTLYAKNLIALPRVTTAKRDVARLDGERGQLEAQIAQAKGKISEIELQVLQIDHDLRTEIVKELREAQGKESELVERSIAAEDQLKRIDIRAPQSGIVHQLVVHTVGGVVTQSEPLMLIVPEGEKLVIEARVAQQDIEQVHPDQQAWIRLTAFNQRTTPEVAGTVERIAADLTREQQTGAAYFIVRITIADTELAKLGTAKLLPGMPADVQIRTTERSALSYLVKPLQDQIAKAFKER
jgi:HlyD family secretion protein